MDSPQNPIILARETLKQLALLKIPPTPDNYHKLYDKISGSTTNVMCESSCQVLSELAKSLPQNTPELANYAKILKQASDAADWHQYKAQLIDALSMSTGHSEPELDFNWADTLKKILKHVERSRGKLTVARKREGLSRVLSNFANDSSLLHIKLKALIDSWAVLESGCGESSDIEVADEMAAVDTLKSSRLVESELTLSDPSVPYQSSQLSGMTGQLQTVLAQVLEYMAATQLGGTSLSGAANLLVQKVRDIQNEQDLVQLIPEVKKFCVNFKSCEEECVQLQQGLWGLLNSFIDSTEYFLTGDQWIKNQMSKLRETMSNSLDIQVVEQVGCYLKELINKQDLTKKNLDDAQVAMKEMVTCLIKNIEEFSSETGDYHDKIGSYSEQIQQVDNIESLNKLLAELMQDTRKMQASTLSSRSEFLAVRAEVDAAQGRIMQLESELSDMSEKVQEDHLTGTLNRRGLETAFEREAARVVWQQTSLCLAVLDIDDFKKLNDTYGHTVGDDALVYLVEAIKNATRSEDVVARFGGEEFIILLPDTELDLAVSILTRIKRNLTKKFFLYENKRLLITFSAGVAKYRIGETKDELVKRADSVMYQAKNHGKNQVFSEVG